MKVIKRNGRSQEFDTNKIFKVVSFANQSVPELDRITDEQINKLIKLLVKNFKGWNELTTEDIDRIVVNLLVTKYKAGPVVQSYVEKREAKKNKKKFNDIEEKVLAIIEGDSDLRGENANKHIDQNCSISDYIAGVTTKSIVEKIMPEDIAHMHKMGLGHMHDTDYSPIRPMHNCFTGDTRFLVAEDDGEIYAKRFDSFKDGDKVIVYDRDGYEREATVHCYGEQNVYTVQMRKTTDRYIATYVLRCTPNHRWYLKDGSVTTKLSVGDILYGGEIEVISIVNKDEKETVWCVEEPETHSFTLDYNIPTGNCDLLNVGDMLENGFLMGSTRICVNDETTFETICNLIAQINLIVSGSQYGGQTISWIHAVPYIDKSRKMIEKQILREWKEDGVEYNEDKFRTRVESRVREEVAKGVKTYQYQILCHCSSNGQTPFVSNNLCLREAENQRELDDFAMLIEEILKRRTKGVQDETGQYISPLFPKLLYWTSDGLNVKEGDPYFYLMKYVAECESLRMQPDICSEKQTRKVKNGQIIPSMGCRSMLSPIWEEHVYPVDKEFYFVEGVGEYPYGTFVDKKSFADFENREYKTGYEDGEVAINFRGNTGWLLSKSDTEVVILEPIVYGRFNCGVFSLNLPHIALSASYSEYAIEHDEVIKYNGTDVTPAELLVMMIEDDTVELNDEENKAYPIDTIILDNFGTLDHFDITTNADDSKNVRLIYKLSEDDKIQRFYEILDERMEIAHKALQFRYKYVRRIKGKNSPILWQWGALARLSADETVGELIDRYPTRPSISIGYAGLYETCQALIQESNITPRGQKLSQAILHHMNDKIAEWKAKEGLGYAIYGTPEESLTYKFALANRRDFGLISKITDKDYVVNSYHIDPREKVDAFTKLRIEGNYLALSAGGAVSYVETADLIKNPEAVITIVQYINDHIMYAEINRKIGVCKKCGYVGDIPLLKENGEFIFRCPECGNTDDSLMDVTARICGYLGKVNAGNTNKGRLDDIFNRVIHTDCEDEIDINLMMNKTTDKPACYEAQ